MMMNMCKLLLVFSLTLIWGCGGKYISDTTVLSAGAAAASGFAAYELAPDDWTQSERTALGFGVAGATYIVGEILGGKISQDKVLAYTDGFNAGRAYNARRRYEFIQALQRDTQSSTYRTKTYQLEAPVSNDANYVSHPIYLEVKE